MNLHHLIGLGLELLEWDLTTAEGQQRMAADLRLALEARAYGSQFDEVGGVVQSPRNL